MDLAQLNVSRMLAPIDSAQMADFVARIDHVNSAAENAPGFVWRLTGPVPSRVLRRVFGEDQLLVNLSVWRSAEELAAFVFRDDQHFSVMRRRREWFEATADAMVVCWWLPEGTVPTLWEAGARLQRLRTEGPGPDAFPLSHAATYPPWA